MAKDDEISRSPTYLRQWRKYRKLTQEQAVENLGIDRTTLARIETGVLPYGQDFLDRAARAYDCDPADLLMRDPGDKSSLMALLKLADAADEDKKMQIRSFIRFTLEIGEK